MIFKCGNKNTAILIAKEDKEIMKYSLFYNKKINLLICLEIKIVKTTNGKLVTADLKIN